MDASTLNEALLKLFPCPEVAGEPVERDATLQLLYRNQREGISSNSILMALKDQALHPDIYATIALLDQQLTPEINKAELPQEVADKLRGIIIAVMRTAIADGVLATTKGPIISILDSLLHLTIGWSDLRGRALDLLDQRFQETLTAIHLLTRQLDADTEQQRARNYLLELIENDIVQFVSSERDRTIKLEQRLVEAKSGHLTAERSRTLATQLLNEQMQDKTIPKPFVNFLHGVWFDSLQLIATREGADSNQWQRVVQLTETLISTVQPAEAPKSESAFEEVLNAVAPDVEPEPTLNIEDPMTMESSNDKPEPAADLTGQHNPDQQLFRIIEHLPDELRSCLVSIEHDADAINNELGQIESVHVQIMKGEPVEGFEFEMLQDDSDTAPTRVSESLLASVARLSTGSWFVFSSEDEPAKHIKLTLKDDESELLVFTNRNGVNVLQSSYEDYAYLLSSGAAIQLSPPGDLLKQVRFKLMETLKQQAKADRAKELKVRRLAAEKRKEAMAKTQFVLVAVDREKLAAGAKAEDLIDAEAILSAAQSDHNVIFVDKSGLDLGEVDSEEIAQLIRGENPEEVVDEMPTDMEDFRASVEKIRQPPKFRENPDAD